MADKGRSRRGRRTTIAGQFNWRLIEMLESPAFRVLSQSGHRVLARLEIELAHHGGNDNGKLPTTFDGAKSAYGSTSPASAGAQSVHANDLVIFGVADQAPTTFGTPEGGWMPLMPARSNHTEQRVWFTVAAATGTLAPSVTETALSWDAAVAAFRH